MAEINTPGGVGRPLTHSNSQKFTGRLTLGAIRRCKKLSTKVDLTPMVDLGFLLITFFIFTTAMARPTAMKLFLPAGDIATMPTGVSVTLTLIPVSSDKIFYYHGDLETAMQKGLYGVTGFPIANGIGNIIRQKQTALDKNPKFSRNDMMLIIKPSPASNYRNIVDLLDEVLINNIIHYSLVDIDKAEKEMLQKQQLE